MAIVSVGYDGTVDEVQFAKMIPSVGSSQYGVTGGSDWKVSAHPSTAQAVNISAGSGWGCGVFDVSDSVATVQCDTIASGTTRWDMITAKRDWQPVNGTTAFSKITGGVTMALPTRLNNPGVQDEQPLALVKWTGGQTQPTAIIDLRCWAGNGGMVAADDLAKGYLNRLGTAVWIDDLLWRYQPGLNDVPEWVSGSSKAFSPLAVPGYTLAGKVYLEPGDENRKQVTVDINVTRTGSAGSIPKDDWASFGAVLPVAVRGDADPKYVPVSVIGGTISTAVTNAHATVFLNPSSGLLQIRGVNTFTWNTGALFSLNLSYYI